ncbi:mycothiol synthase [Georgenia sp. Z1344]|uniref:mycothiol synthase n=1 Tax=Georgenia sp. Z1344 TaxID=3416706 RepID=UPI003CE8AA6A
MRTADRLSADEADAVRALAAEAKAADGVGPLDEQTLLRLAPDSARAATHLLLEDEDGALLGYAQVADGSGELVVAPAARRRGLGRQLLVAAREIGGDVSVEGTSGTDAGLAVWAHGDLPGAQALAGSLGLTRVRELLRMGAQVRTDDAPQPPAGTRIETFDVDAHAEPWLRVNARAFATHPEQGRMTRADLDERLAQPWFDPELLLLAYDEAADDDGPRAPDPLGFIWMKPGDPGEAELYVLGVDPSAQGRGLGRDLTARGLAEVAARGRSSVDLYVEGDNAPALATYERQGFAVVERHSQYA